MTEHKSNVTPQDRKSLNLREGIGQIGNCVRGDSTNFADKHAYSDDSQCEIGEPNNHLNDDLY